MKLFYFGMLCLAFTISYGQELYTKTGTDRPWSEIIANKEIPVGSNSTKGIKGSKIDVNNALVEKGPYANLPIKMISPYTP